MIYSLAQFLAPKYMFASFQEKPSTNIKRIKTNVIVKQDSSQFIGCFGLCTSSLSVGCSRGSINVAMT